MTFKTSLCDILSKKSFSIWGIFQVVSQRLSAINEATIGESDVSPQASDGATYPTLDLQRLHYRITTANKAQCRHSLEIHVQSNDSHPDDTFSV